MSAEKSEELQDTELLLPSLLISLLTGLGTEPTVRDPEREGPKRKVESSTNQAKRLEAVQASL